jgi:hypothetical protein
MNYELWAKGMRRGKEVRYIVLDEMQAYLGCLRNEDEKCIDMI